MQDFFPAIVCLGSVDFFNIIDVMRQSYEYKDKGALTLLRNVYMKHGSHSLFVEIVPKIIQVTTEIIIFNEALKYLMCRF